MKQEDLPRCEDPDSAARIVVNDLVDATLRVFWARHGEKGPEELIGAMKLANGTTIIYRRLDSRWEARLSFKCGRIEDVCQLFPVDLSINDALAHDLNVAYVVEAPTLAGLWLLAHTLRRWSDEVDDWTPSREELDELGLEFHIVQEII